MIVETLHNDSWAKTYLLIDKSSKKAAIIDSVFGRHEQDLDFIQQNDLDLIYAIATHTHADHVTACFDLREKTGCEYVMYNNTVSLGVSKYVQNGESLILGNSVLTFYFAPGHTNDSMVIRAGHNLFTGDFLFTGEAGVGRDDLPSGRPEVHWKSLKLLDNFSDNLMVYSGHDPPNTEMKSLGWNRLNNPVLNFNNFEEYLSWQKKQWENLGEVTKIKTAIPANIFADTSPDTN